MEGDSEYISRLRFAHSYHVKMLHFAEAKHGALILTCTTILIFYINQKPIPNTIFVWFLPLFTSLWAITPRTIKYKTEGQSLLFFSDVHGIASRKNKASDFDENDFLREKKDLIGQIIEISKITVIKMRLFSGSVIFFVISIFSMLFIR